MKLTLKPFQNSVEAHKAPVKSKLAAGPVPDAMFDELLGAIAMATAARAPTPSATSTANTDLTSALKPQPGESEGQSERSTAEEPPIAIGANRVALRGLSRACFGELAPASVPTPTALTTGQPQDSENMDAPLDPACAEPESAPLAHAAEVSGDAGLPPDRAQDHLTLHLQPAAVGLPATTTQDAAPIPAAARMHEMAEPMAQSAALLAVRVGTPEHTSVQMSHPDLGRVSLEMHARQGCLEVTAVLETEAAVRLVRASEQGVRQGVQRGGMSFSGLKVRLQGDESGSRGATRNKARRERGKKD